MPVNLSLQERPYILVHQLMFADNTVFMVHNHQGAQKIINFSKSAKVIWLKINLKKTEIMYQPLLGSHDIGQDIQIQDQALIQVNKFKYVSSKVANNNNNRLYVELDI